MSRVVASTTLPFATVDDSEVHGKEHPDDHIAGESTKGKIGNVDMGTGDRILGELD